MTDSVKTRMTAAEYLELPETNTPMQLIDGEVIVSPSPVPLYQHIVGRIFRLIAARADERGGTGFFAPIDVQLDEHNIVQPDVLYLAPETQCIEGDKHLIGAPDLVVEVLSPGTAKEDKRTKFRLYERHGVREYWIVDPRDQLVEIWQGSENRFSLLDVYSPGETFESALVGQVEVAAFFPTQREDNAPESHSL